MKKEFFMKKMIFLCVLASVFLLSGCAPRANMSDLLSYQEQAKTMTLRITDGEVFHIQWEKTDGAHMLIFTDGDRKNVGYQMDANGKISMIYEDFTVPIADTQNLKCAEWFSLFSISAGETIWKIKKELLGGIEVFVCRDGTHTIYIETKTKIPLRIEKGDISMDILSLS
jgi:hypothetical protein